MIHILFLLGNKFIFRGRTFLDINGGTSGVDTLTVYDGDYALKVWGQYSGTYPKMSLLYQNHLLSDLGLEPGDAVAVEGHMMSPGPDYVGQGNNSAYHSYRS